VDIDIKDGKSGVSILREHSGARESVGLAGEVSGKIIELAWEEDSDVAGGGGGLPSKGGCPSKTMLARMQGGTMGRVRDVPSRVGASLL